MPLFDYKCEHCGNEVLDHRVPRFSVDRTLACACGWEMIRQVSRCGFYLKGGGWANGGYVKDVVHRPDGIKTTVEGDTRVLK